MKPTYLESYKNGDFSDATHTFYFEDWANGCCRSNSQDDFDTAGAFLAELSSVGLESILENICSCESEIVSITPKNIPQFSDIEYAINDILEIVEANPAGDFALYGYFFKKEAQVGAQRKYGENHYKLASLFGLVTWDNPHEITPLGKAFSVYDDDTKKKVLPYLVLRIPIIQRLIIEAQKGPLFPCYILSTCLSDSTVLRRKPNIRTLLELVCESLPYGSKLMEQYDWSYK